MGKFIYSHDSDGVRVNLFIPSVLSWKDKGVELTQHCNLLETDEVEFRLKARREQRFVLRIRKPEWMKNPTFIINGKEEELVTDSSGYCLFDRVWAHDNKIVLKYSMKPYIERLKKSDKYVALLYGPYVLAGRFGKKNLPDSFWSTMNNTARRELDLKEIPSLAYVADAVADNLKVISRNICQKIGRAHV